MNFQTRDVRVARLSASDAIECIGDHLRGRGYAFRSFSTEPTKISFEAGKPKTRFIRRLFSNEPQAVFGDLAAVTPDETEITLQFGNTVAFVLQLLVVEAIGLLWGIGSAVAFLKTRSGGTIISSLFNSFCFANAVGGVMLFQQIYLRTGGYSRFADRIYREAVLQVTVDIRQTEIPDTRGERDWGTLLLFFFGSVAMFIVPSNWARAAAGVVFFLAIGQIIILRRHRRELQSAKTAVLLLMPATIFAIHGILPILIAFLSRNSGHMWATLVLLPYFVLQGTAVMRLKQLLKPEILHPSASDRGLPWKVREGNWAIRQFLVFVWLILGSANIVGGFIAVAVFSHAIFGATFVPGTGIAKEMSSVYFSFFSLLYVSPILIFWGMALHEIISEWKAYQQGMKNSPSNSELYGRAKELVRHMCEYAHIASPRVVLIQSEAIAAFVTIPPFPMLPIVLNVSVGALKQLPQDELEALIAHEVGHLKSHHTTALALVNLFSRGTLLGNGFLLAMLPPSSQMEAEADQFAAAWLDTTGIGREALIRLLSKLEPQKFFESSLNQNVRPFPTMPNASVASLIADFDFLWFLKPVWDRLIYPFRLLRFLYFGHWLNEYEHPSLSERTKTIREVYDFQPEKGVIGRTRV